MTERPGSELQGGGDTALPRDTGSGAADASAPAADDYRRHLRSRRWNAAPLRNPEVQKTDPRIAVAAIATLSVITLVVLVVGYGSGFWG